MAIDSLSLVFLRVPLFPSSSWCFDVSCSSSLSPGGGRHYLNSSVGEALRSHRLWKLTGNISTYSPYTHTHTQLLSYTSPPPPHQEGETQPPQVLRTCSRPPQHGFCCPICFGRGQNDENCAAFRGNTIENLLSVSLSHFVSFVAKQSTVLISQINTRAVQNCWETVARQHNVQQRIITASSYSLPAI